MHIRRYVAELFDDLSQKDAAKKAGFILRWLYKLKLNVCYNNFIMATLPDITNNKIISKILGNKIILGAAGLCLVILFIAVLAGGKKTPGSLSTLSANYKGSQELIKLFDKYKPQIDASDAATQQLVTQTRILLSGNSQEIITYATATYEKKEMTPKFKKVTKPNKQQDKQLADAIKINAFEANVVSIIKTTLQKQKKDLADLQSEPSSPLEKLIAKLNENIDGLMLNPLML